MAQESANITSETTHLLVNTASARSCSSLQQKRICRCPPSKNLCLPSKAAILIITWTAVVGLMYYSCFAALISITISPKSNASLSEYHTLVYALLALIMMFYPLSGFIADVCCGRLMTVVVSLILLLIFIISSSLELIVDHTMTSHHLSSIGHDQGILVVILLVLAVSTFVLGLVGYQANFINLDWTSSLKHQVIIWVSLFITLPGLSI